MIVINSSFVVVFLLVIVSSAQSKLIEKHLGNAADWRTGGDDENLARFNSMYLIPSINEENLNINSECTGRCDNLDNHGKKFAQNLTGWNQCFGDLTNCWLERETIKRKTAQYNVRATLPPPPCRGGFCGYVYWDSASHNRYKEILRHTGNICTCFCHHTFNPNPVGARGELVDSICYDPVSVDEGLVATGIRFKRRKNIIYLQLQQGELTNNRIFQRQKEWTDIKPCSAENTKPVYDWQNTKYVPLKIVLEDIQLPENSVVTSVTLGESIRGRYVTDRGNIDQNRNEFVVRSQCRNRNTQSVFSHNGALSESCQHHIEFQGPTDNNPIPFIIPFVDLQEVVTPGPQPIRGVGWYHRGFHDHGGFLALKIFMEE